MFKLLALLCHPLQLSLPKFIPVDSPGGTACSPVSSTAPVLHSHPSFIPGDSPGGIACSPVSSTAPALHSHPSYIPGDLHVETACSLVSSTAPALQLSLPKSATYVSADFTSVAWCFLNIVSPIYISRIIIIFYTVDSLNCFTSAGRLLTFFFLYC
jgi:hypothetical protein